VRVDEPVDMQLDAKRMTVQAGALMAGGHVGEAVDGLDGENAEDVQAGRQTGP